MCHQPILARNPVGAACTASIFGTSLCQHARIGITAVLYTHTTVALYRNTLHTQYIPDLAKLLGELVSS
jgi:hypothetical protein